MGNTVEQERELVRRWEDVANELPRALGAPGQVMLVPSPAGQPGLTIIVGGRDEAAIIPAAQDGEWEVSFDLGALDIPPYTWGHAMRSPAQPPTQPMLPYSGEYAALIADRLTRCALTRLACEAPAKAGCLDIEDTRISWAEGGRFQGRPLINLDGCDSVGDARRELREALASLARDTVAPVLRKRLQRAVEGRPGVILGDVEAWDAVDFTVESTVTGRVLSWARVGNDGILHYVAGGRRFELPVWPGRGEDGLGARAHGIINKFLDLVQDDIHNHTFTEENNR